MANYLVTDAQLQAIADKIRAKTGTVGGIEFTSEFLSEIEKLTDTRDATAAAGDLRSGKTAYVNGSKVSGNLMGKAAATYNTSSSDQTIASGQILDGAQTIKAVTTSNIDAGNIKKGVVVKVGDANSAGRIKNVTGTAYPTVKMVAFTGKNKYAETINGATEVAFSCSFTKPTDYAFPVCASSMEKSGTWPSSLGLLQEGTAGEETVFAILTNNFGSTSINANQITITGYLQYCAY